MNDNEHPNSTVGTDRVSASELRQFVERIENLENEKRDIGEQIKEVYAELKGQGYDTKVVRDVVARRRKPTDEIAEHEAVLELYEEALKGRTPG